MYGIIPKDYNIYKKLKIINDKGDQNFDKEKQDKQKKIELEFMSKDERFINMVSNKAHQFIVNRDSNFYQIEQLIITFLCIVSSYFYAYMSLFFEDNLNFEIIIESIFLVDFILTFFVEVKPIINTDPPIRNFS